MSGISYAQTYTAERTSDHGIDVVRLTDAAHGIEVSVAPSLGNRAYEMRVHGKDILYHPRDGFSDIQYPKLGAFHSWRRGRTC